MMNENDQERDREPRWLVPRHELHPLAVLWSMIAGVILLVFVIAGIIAAWSTFMAGATIMIKILVVLVVVLVPAGAIAGLVVLVQTQLRRGQIAGLEVDRARRSIKNEDNLNAAQVRHLDTQTEVLRRSIRFDSLGNAGILDDSGRIVQLRGNYQELPNLSSIHSAHKIDGRWAEQAALPAPAQAWPKPTIEEMVGFVRPNGYELVLGRSIQSGELIKIELPDAHIKLIGGSRMGKSCEAAAILEQARKSHDPTHLRMALLDLEYKTSRLFEGDPHILTLKTEYKNVRMHAKDVKQVAEGLIWLHELMVHRYTLTEAQLLNVAHVLIYLEEFLYWKKLLGHFVSSQMREQALAAFTGIATRGLKVGLHLMACAQVDYADEELKDAMAQFLAVNVAFSVKPTAAQAAGFVNTALLKKNYEARVKGQFVVEAIGGSDLGIAPEFDVQAKLQALTGVVDADDQPQDSSTTTRISQAPPSREIELFETLSKDSRSAGRNERNTALQAKVEQVMENPGENMADCIKRVWGATPGDNTSYKLAKREYIQVLEIIHAMARRAMQSCRSSEMEEK